MDRSYVMKNTKSRERLHRLVSDISDSDLELVIYKEGWTIAAALAHLAFWDERRLFLVRKWKRKGVSPSPYDEHIINNALLPFLLAIPPRKSANLAIITAEALDRELEELSPDLIAAIKALGDRHALNRGNTS